MASPLRRQRDALIAKTLLKASPTAYASSPAALTLPLMELEADKATLKSFNAIADKIAHKRTVLIPKYRPMADAFLNADDVHDNPVFTHVVLWLFDVGEIHTFIEWCFVAIEKGLPSPSHIKRDWPTFCADSVYDWAHSQAEKGDSIEPYFSMVFEQVRHHWRLHEKVVAKWYKLAGLQQLRDDTGKPNVTAIGDVEQLKEALALLTGAHECYDKIGVTDLIKNRIPARINALTAETDS
ncbi:phage terminase small subunit [Grimontia marina]|uniref:Phage small terminase subunit n=1 Tax=Grimontia marina TaxID=646534 RepID=A0A128FA79_9GAMM|nr:phage terminase small subunit [Grimontia marina]CZF83191.1 Phage small terminase subunit [Grimontia marina]